MKHAKTDTLERKGFFFEEDAPAAEPAPAATPPSAATGDTGFVFPTRLGPQIHTSGLRRRTVLKVKEQGAPTTTRQAEVLNTALVGTPGDERGVINGIDRLSSAMIAHDPFTGYEDGKLTSPNVCILGAIGVGKSTTTKTVYVERPLLLRKRRAVVIDKKTRGGEGEYAELTRKFGAEPFRFEIGGGSAATTLNLLDPIILAGGGPAVHRQLLNAFADLAGDGALNEWDHKALTSAYEQVMHKFENPVPGRKVPLIQDLLELLPGVVDRPEFNRMRESTKDKIDEAAWSVRFRFERLLSDELTGMFDRETSKHVQLHPKLTTFDISSLPEEGPATSMVMVAANAWLMGMLTGLQGIRTNFIAEEGWHLLGGPGGKVIRSKSKLSRALGLSIVAVLHHISDIPKDSEAIAMIKEAQTIHLFRQDRDDDIADCINVFNLEESNGASLASLPQGDFLLKVGNTREIRVHHLRTEAEIKFTETDAAMISGPRGGSHA